MQLDSCFSFLRRLINSGYRLLIALFYNFTIDLDFLKDCDASNLFRKNVIDHRKFTDLFKLLQTTVDLIDPRLERGCNFTFGQRPLLLVKLPGDSLSLRHDQRRDEGTSVPQKNRLADKWIVLQEKLDEAGINIRTVGAIENVFLPAGDKKTAICIDGAEIT